MRPVLFYIGRFPVRAYGTLLVSGFLVGLWRAMRLCERRMRCEPEGSRRRIHPDTIFDVGIIGLLLSLLGARILFVALNWSSFADHPIEVFKVWAGGLSLHGGMFAGILFLAVYCRRKRLSLLAVGDVCAPSWAIAYAIGRIGCLLNGCCYGAVCSLPWAMRFPDEQHPGLLTPPSHPTQLYATAFNLVFFVWLLLWERRPRRDGELFFGYIAMYGFYRFIDETFRVGATSEFIAGTHLTLAHIVSVIMFAIGLGAIVSLRRRGPAYADAREAAAPPSAPPLEKA